MKKILFGALMLLAIGGVTYAQTTPTKTSSTQKKEAVKKETKPASSVSSVSPVNTSKSTESKTKTVTKTNTKPASTSSASKQTIPASAIGKHRKHHTAKKKSKKQ